MMITQKNENGNDNGDNDFHNKFEVLDIKSSVALQTT